MYYIHGSDRRTCQPKVQATPILLISALCLQSKYEECPQLYLSCGRWGLTLIKAATTACFCCIKGCPQFAPRPYVLGVAWHKYSEAVTHTGRHALKLCTDPIELHERCHFCGPTFARSDLIQLIVVSPTLNFCLNLYKRNQSLLIG